MTGGLINLLSAASILLYDSTVIKLTKHSVSVQRSINWLWDVIAGFHSSAGSSSLMSDNNNLSKPLLIKVWLQMKRD